MLNAEQIQHALEDRNLMAIARACDVSYETVRKLAQGKADNLRHSSVIAIIKYLEQRQQQ